LPKKAPDFGAMQCGRVTRTPDRGGGNGKLGRAEESNKRTLWRAPETRETKWEERYPVLRARRAASKKKKMEPPDSIRKVFGLIESGREGGKPREKKGTGGSCCERTDEKRGRKNDLIVLNQATRRATGRWWSSKIARIEIKNNKREEKKNN